MTLDREQVARALPGYDIGDEIGRGGWGVVIRADHRQLGRPVAVKELPRAFAADPGVRRRFVSEARLLATLDHPHIVPIYDFVEQDGLCLLVMELLPGGTLWDRFTTTGVSHDSACSIVVAACSALHYAHGKGILHRDIKPENLLFAASGTLKVSDFGIAKVVGGTASMATRTGEVLGTPAYMAPEQALGSELTAGTDVYALGTVLYELLSGRLPFVDDGNAIALLYRHVHEAPTPLSEVAPDLPSELVETTMRALAADPADRFENAEDFGVALADAAGSALGPDWLQRGGIAVMATGRIGARISGPHRLDTEPRPPTPAFPPPSAGPAPHTVLEGAVSAPATAPPAESTHSESVVSAEPAAAHGTVLDGVSPAELVPVQDVVADSPAPVAESLVPLTGTPSGAAAPPAPPPGSVPPSPPVSAPPAPAAPGPGARKRRRGVFVAVALLVIAAVVAGVVVLGKPGSKTASSKATTPGTTAVGSTASNPTSVPAGSGPPVVAATITVLARPEHLAFGMNAIFVTESTSKGLARIDPADNQVTQVASLPASTHALAATDDSLWVSGAGSATFWRVRPGAGTAPARVTTLSFGKPVSDIAAGDGSVWIAAPFTNELLRIDPATEKVVATIPVGATADSIAVDASGVWVANKVAAGTVTRVDPATNRVVATTPVGPFPDQVVFGEGAVWTANHDGTVSRIDPATNKVAATITVGGQPKSLLAGEGGVWVSITSGSEVRRIDPATNTVTDTLTVGSGPDHGVIGAGSVWVVNDHGSTISRIRPGG